MKYVLAGMLAGAVLVLTFVTLAHDSEIGELRTQVATLKFQTTVFGMALTEIIQNGGPPRTQELPPTFEPYGGVDLEPNGLPTFEVPPFEVPPLGVDGPE